MLNLSQTPKNGRPNCHEGPQANVFVFPGIYGDEPELRAFRRSCEPHLQLTLVDLPEVSEDAALLRDIGQTGTRLAHLVGQLQPQGDLLIAGFSFGGSVAVEVAQQLMESGRQVNLIAVFDAVLAPEEVSGRGGLSSSGYRQLVWSLLTPMIDWDPGRRLVLRIVERWWPHRLRVVRRRLLWSLRKRALNQWRPQPLSAPLLLVISEQFARMTLSSWLTLAPDAEIVRLAGEHVDILKPPAVSILRTALFEAVESVKAVETVS